MAQHNRAKAVLEAFLPALLNELLACGHDEILRVGNGGIDSMREFILGKFRGNDQKVAEELLDGTLPLRGRE